MLRPSPILFRRLPANRTPFDAKESSKLLESLTKTFRHSLDTAHPGFDASTEASSSQTAGVQHAAAVTGPLPETIAGRHLKSILTNPVLNFRPSKDACQQDRDPMDVFREAVAYGQMTLTIAELCLKAKHAQIQRSSTSSSDKQLPRASNAPSEAVQSEMQRSGAGRMVLQWLLSDSSIHDISFWRGPTKSKYLILFLAAEGLSNVFLAVLQREKSTRKDHLGQSVFAEHVRDSRMVDRLIEAEALHHSSLEQSCKVYLQAHQLGLDGESHATQTLARLICARHGSLQHGISPESFDAVVSLFRVQARLPPLQLAYIDLLHPATPSATAATACLRSLDQSHNRAWSRPKQQSILKLGLQAADLLHKTGQAQAAQEVLTILRRLVPSELGIDESPVSSKERASTKNAMHISSLLNRLQPG